MPPYPYKVNYAILLVKSKETDLWANVQVLSAKVNFCHGSQFTLH